MTSIIEHIEKFKKIFIIVAAVILTFLVGVLDTVTGVEFSVSLFYLIPILICAWFVDKWSGIIFSVLSAVIFLIADKLALHDYSHPLIPYWNALIQFGFFATASLILSALKRSIEFENSLAVRIQQGLLPKKFPTFKNYDSTIIWKPKSFVSGDYYDFISIDENRIGICIGDVAGHGVAAALLMSNLQATVRQVSRQNITLDKVCYELNNSLMDNETTGTFITFFYAIIDYKKNILEYSNAGHPPALIVGRNGAVRKLESGGVMLGVVRDTEYPCESIQLSDGDKVIFYTDGLIEAKNLKRELFGDERFINTCVNNYSDDLSSMSQKIINSISQYASGIMDDDVTLLIISYSSSAH